jgi:hypothetical protein
VDDTGVLSGRDVRLAAQAAGEQELAASVRPIGEPIADCRPRLFGDLELDRPAGFPLNDRGTVSHLAANANVVDAQAHEIAPAQLAVYGQIEQREVAPASLKLEPNADCPDLPRF